ncbi:MAG: XdhC family protein [Sphingomonadales bacterium]|nr:XdhC family protein [Sphingomonadales bacterium]
MKLDSADWPTFGWIADVRPALREAARRRRSVVLGTLTGLSGSAPRPVGTQMVFDGAKATGYFSGGCLEADVANHAAEVLADGTPRRLVYGEGSPWIDVRLVCGGRIEILLERIVPDDPAIAEVLVRTARRQPAWLASDGQRREAGDQPSGLVGAAYELRLNPAWQAFIVGGDPIALAIARLTALSGFETTLFRPLGPLTAPPLPQVGYCRDALDQAFAPRPIDRWTALVTATHDDDLDDRALVHAARSGAGYAGVLGSTRRIAARRLRLERAGLSSTQIAAIRTPIGLGRCGKAPWEVATSVLAEIMSVRAS